MLLNNFFFNIDFKNKGVRGLVGVIIISCFLYDIMRIVVLIYFIWEGNLVIKFVLEGCFWICRLLKIKFVIDICLKWR